MYPGLMRGRFLLQTLFGDAVALLLGLAAGSLVVFRTPLPWQSNLGLGNSIWPLVGLLGTVWGIMRAFRDMAMTGSAAPSVVAAGVAEALITTAAGLVVAVPAVILFNHFSRRMNVMLTIAENHARKLRSSLVEQSVAETTASANGSPDSLAAVERRAA